MGTLGNDTQYEESNHARIAHSDLPLRDAYQASAPFAKYPLKETDKTLDKTSRAEYKREAYSMSTSPSLPLSWS